MSVAPRGATARAGTARAGTQSWYEHAGWHGAALAGLAACFLALSWRRWPDPVVDFGRELYIPWRLAAGAVLYRDVDDFYGPLSQYLNSVLFRVFGPGMTVLVAANVVVFRAIVGLTYALVRRAWGPLAALVSGAFFIAVFGFSRFMFAGNFNYATPYAHETTHGVLVLVGLVAVAERWLARPSPRWLAGAGFLFGLTWLLKPEIMLAAAALLAVAAGLQRWRDGWWDGRGFAWALLAVVLPSAFFVGLFLRDLPWADALHGAGRAWLSVVATTAYVRDPAQIGYLGLDAPLRNLGLHLAATLAGLGFLVVVAGVGRLHESAAARPGRRVAAVVIAAGLTIGAALLPKLGWMQMGRSFAGLLIVYLAWRALEGCRARRAGATADRGANGRVLLATLALALLARMVLNGRIYQFGYYQAALAGVVLVAVLVGEFPERVAARLGARRLVTGTLVAILAVGTVLIASVSRRSYAHVTTPMGQGRDAFLVFPTAAPVAAVAAALGHARPGQTLLVLPEGLMLNYLARMPSPVAPFFFYSAATEGGREAKLVAQLAVAPPDWVVTLPRDLREYGITRYGERPGAGAQLVELLAANYVTADGRAAQYGQDQVQLFVKGRRPPDGPRP